MIVKSLPKYNFHTHIWLPAEVSYGSLFCYFLFEILIYMQW